MVHVIQERLWSNDLEKDDNKIQNRMELLSHRLPIATVSPLTTLVALHWTCFNISVSFLPGYPKMATVLQRRSHGW